MRAGTSCAATKPVAADDIEYDIEDGDNDRHNDADNDHDDAGHRRDNGLDSTSDCRDNGTHGGYWWLVEKVVVKRLQRMVA